MHFFLTLLGLAAFGALSSAHTVLTDILINDVHQGDGTCIRMPHDPSTASAPIASPFSNPDMACGRDGGKAVAFSCPATPGSKVTFEFRGWPDYAKPEVIDGSHKGPISIYAKAMSSFDDAAAGDGWFKIWEQGYDAASNTYATSKLIANKGLLSINLPDLPRGQYLIRSEIITLQNVTNEVVAPQFYSGCAQLYIQSDKTSPLSIPPASKASIPGHLSPQDPGLIFNIYDRHRPAYVIPGPAVFFPGPVAPSKVKAATPLSEAQGGIPEACLLKNANWCGFEVPDYTTEDGCWASAEDCWRQADACHDAAPPTGHRNCEVWQAKKCEVLQEACHAKRFTGPPNKGEKIKEEVARVVTAGQIPAVEGGEVPKSGGGSEPKPVPVPVPEESEIVEAPAPTPTGGVASELPGGVYMESSTEAAAPAATTAAGAVSSQPPVSTTLTPPFSTSVASSLSPIGTGTGTGLPPMPSVYVPSPPLGETNKTSPCFRKGRAKGKGAKLFRA